MECRVRLQREMQIKRNMATRHAMLCTAREQREMEKEFEKERAIQQEKQKRMLMLKERAMQEENRKQAYNRIAKSLY